MQRKSGPYEHLQAYLYRIAHNWITDYYRSKPVTQLDIDEQVIIDPTGEPNDALEFKISSQIIRESLMQLNPDQRQVIVLRFLHGWDYCDIAAALNKSVGAIKALQHRGLEKLNTLLMNSELKDGSVIMMDPLDPRIENALDKLRNVPHREVENAVKGRAIFLGEAHKIQPNVSNSEMLRHKGWNQKKSWTTRIFRKETSPMFTTLVSAFLAIVLALGGSGVTLAAAQSSNSDDFLYPLKLFSEDVRLELTNGTPEAIMLELEYLTRRTTELQAIIGENKVPSTGLINRIQEQINTILQQATRLDKEDSCG